MRAVLGIDDTGERGVVRVGFTFIISLYKVERERREGGREGREEKEVEKGRGGGRYGM